MLTAGGLVGLFEELLRDWKDWKWWVEEEFLERA